MVAGFCAAYHVEWEDYINGLRSKWKDSPSWKMWRVLQFNRNKMGTNWQNTLWFGSRDGVKIWTLGADMLSCPCSRNLLFNMTPWETVMPRK